MTETIEHNIQQPETRTHQTPLLFLHGAWHGAWCWEQWMNYFASLGYEVHAISLPAHGKSSSNKGHINFYTFDDYVQTLAAQIESISPKPVVVGHSMGGAILQKYLEKHQLPGAVLLATLPTMGMFPMTLRLLQHHPISTLMGMLTFNLHRWVGTPELSQSLFLNATTQVDVHAFHKQLMSETASNAFSIMFPFAKINQNKSPVFVIAGEKDAVFTVDEERKTAQKYDAKFVVIAGQPHNLMMESAWQQVADEIDHWISHELALS